MAVNIPTPIGAAPQARPGAFEQILLSLASSAPQLLTFFLNQRSQRQSQENARDASAGALAAGIETGDVPLDAAQVLLSQLGGDVSAIVPGGPLPGLNFNIPGAEGSQTIAAAGTAGRTLNPAGVNVDASNVTPGTLGPAVEQFLRIRTSESQRKLTAAETKSVTGREQRADLLFPEQQRLAVAEAEGKEFANAFEKEVRSLRKEQIETSVEANQATIRAAALQGNISITNLITGTYKDEAKRVDALTQLYLSYGLDTQAARAHANADVFKQIDDLTLEDFINQVGPQVIEQLLIDPQAGLVEILQGFSSGGSSAAEVFGLERLGMPPEQIQFIEDQIANALLGEAPSTARVKAAFEATADAIDKGIDDRNEREGMRKLVAAYFSFRFPNSSKSIVVAERKRPSGDILLRLAEGAQALGDVLGEFGTLNPKALLSPASISPVKIKR